MGKSKAAPAKTTTSKAKNTKVKKESKAIHQMRALKMDDLLGDPRWTGTFLPSLAHTLYISHKPFKDFKTKAPEFLEIVQKIFNLSYPEIDLVLKSNDELVKKVRSAMSRTHKL
jgi:hypothetical protein